MKKLPKYITLIETLAGSKRYQVNGRRFNASPSRPQFETLEQAEEALGAMKAAFKAGHGLAHGRAAITFAQQSEKYLTIQRDPKDGMAARTLETVESRFKVHLMPAFGTKKIVEITPAMVREFLAAKSAELNADGTPRLGRESMRHLKNTLSGVFQTAVADQIVASNPTLSARLGSGRTRKSKMASAVAVPKEKTFTQDQQDSLLRWCAEMDAELGDFIFLMLRAGLRPGEARALKWGEIGAKTINVKFNLSARNEEGFTKSGPSRDVDMSAALIKRLAERRAGRPAEGHGNSDSDHVFGNGEPVDARQLGYRFTAAFEACEIKNQVPYNLRHTFASTLYQRTGNIVYVAKMMGHADPSITLKYYSHYLPQVGVRLVDALD